MEETGVLVFRVAGIRCAVRLTDVDHVVGMVRPSPVIGGPGHLAGTVSLHGTALPVYSARAALGLPPRTLRLPDVLIITHPAGNPAGLWADGIVGVEEGTAIRDTGGTGLPVQVNSDGTVMIGNLADLLSNADPAAIRAILPPVTDLPDEPQSGNDPAPGILSGRVRKLARPAGGVESASLVELLRFRLAYREYAIGMQYVREVILTGSITPVPGTPGFITGICAVRGEIISLVDLRILFSLTGKGLTDLNRVIVVSDGTITFGILADSITGMITIPGFLIAPAGPGSTNLDPGYVLGVVDGMEVLDGGSILRDPRMVVDDSIA